AHARRDHASARVEHARSSGRRLGRRAGGEPRGLGLLAGGCVPVESAARRRPVDATDELGVLGGDLLGVALVDRVTKAPCQRLDGRAIAQILEPLAGGGADALLLLANVRHALLAPVREKARYLRGQSPG